MRRKDKEINDIVAIESIIRRASVCRLAMCQDGRPYMVPLCFGYKDRTLYFHSAEKGRKIEILRRNNNVCFEVDIDHQLMQADQACGWGMKYRSVMGFGRARLIEDAESKRQALDIIMQHYSDKAFEYPSEAIESTMIIKVEIDSMTGKSSGY